jgi:hypothetical protein
METQAFFENIQTQIQTRLRNYRAQLLDALHGLRTHETFETI